MWYDFQRDNYPTEFKWSGFKHAFNSTTSGQRATLNNDQNPVITLKKLKRKQWQNSQRNTCITDRNHQ